MSTGDKYFTAPLAALRIGQSSRDALDAVVCSGLVNAGLGYLEHHGEDKFAALGEQADEAAQEQKMPTKPPQRFTLTDCHGCPISHERAVLIWKAAHAGAKLCGVTGGNRASDAQVWATHDRKIDGRTAPFFTIKSEWLWNAVYTARREAGDVVAQEFKPLSWREFRILAGILSSKVNSYNFTFCGWELVQARACGFHSKELFNAGKMTLPVHCQPLTRQMIRDTCDKMEALGFFGRCRYSSGKAGGYMAYSFRHPKRDDLVNAIKQWRAANEAFKAKTAVHRVSDQEAFKRTKSPPTDNQHK